MEAKRVRLGGVGRSVLIRALVAALAVAAMVTCIFGTNQAHAASLPSVTYQAHVQDKGWMSTVRDGATAGTTGQKLRMEGLKITLRDGSSSAIRYRAHVKDAGWQDWRESGQLAGTTGQKRRIEAVRVELTGAYAQKYDVLYRTHVANAGWLSWCKNGSVSGSVGLGLRAEAVQVKICPKGTSVSGVAVLEKPALKYRAHSADVGWQGYVAEGATAGTTGRAKRLEALVFDMKDFYGANGITARAHVSGDGWQKWVGRTGTVGTTGRSRAIEAVQIKLDGALSGYLDVYYRLHLRNVGWLGWARNGETAGSTGQAVPAEAIQVRVVRKGASFGRGGSATYVKPVPPAPDPYAAKVSAFLADARWRNGAAWGGGQRPKVASYTAYGCCAYACDFAKYVFGANSYRSGQAFYSPSAIRAGDIVKVTNNQHWFVVLSRSGDSLRTAEGNWTGGRVAVSDGAYTVSGNTLCRNGKRFRTFSVGYHMK